MASIALLGAVVLLVLAGMACYETATYTPRGPNDDMSLVGVGYIVAIGLALPGALAALLAAPALALRARAPQAALAMSVVALLIIALAVAPAAYTYLPTL